MTPLDQLRETFNCVEKALSETLRFDYGPEHSRSFHKECCDRLDEIKAKISIILPNDTQTIASRLAELENLGIWISLIERSQLGEFSWPFANYIRKIATEFLSEYDMNNNLLEPIIHIVPEGGGYRILNEGQVPTSSGQRRFAAIIFPRPLKQHVLYHPIFGHELGHTAACTTSLGSQITSQVLGSLIASSKVFDVQAITAWLHEHGAPQAVQKFLGRYPGYQFPDSALEPWWAEFICDLFGLFGPSFLASHQALLRPSHPSPHNFLIPTHPPYSTRHRLLVQAIGVLGWDQPVTKSLQQPTNAETRIQNAEIDFYRFVADDPFPPWSTVFSLQNVKDAVDAIASILTNRAQIYTPASPSDIVSMVDNINWSLPPLTSSIGDDGEPLLRDLTFPQIILAGWIAWIGHAHLSGSSHSFFDINRLCGQALTQQTAIDLVALKGLGP